MSKGLFITLEGAEGGGKSTQREYMGELLKEAGYKVTMTREPGGTPLAERIREILLTPSDEQMCVDTELLLMFAARAQHVNQVIKPYLEKGHIVLCDRFVDSTYAYQHSGRGVSKERIRELEHFVLGDFRPDMTFLLDLDVKVGMQRAAARGKLDRFEQEHMDFFEKVRSGFLDRYHNPDHPYVLIDASASLDEVKTKVRYHLNQLLLNHTLPD